MTIPAGQTVTVTFPLTDETFLWWDASKQDMVPLRGTYQLLCGGDSVHLRSVDYEY
jgi:hypothetical protein